MIIALTYDLRTDWLAAGYTPEQTAEFDAPRTIEAIESSIADLGHTPVRIGRLHALVERLARGERWDLAFNIAEGMHGIGREAQVPALLDAYGIPYTFSDPLVMALTLHKAMTKRVIRDLGIATPDFTIIERPDEADAIDLRFPLFAKPIAEGTSKGITAASRLETRAALRAACERLLAEFKQPVLVETYLPGREVTVGLLGTGSRARAIGTMEVRISDQAEAGIYTQNLKEDWHGRLKYTLPDAALCEEAEAIALRVWQGLGCRDAGRVDLRQGPDGRLQFIEVNPLAGLHPEHSDLPILCGLKGIAYGELIGWIIESAMGRVGGSVEARTSGVD